MVVRSWNILKIVIITGLIFSGLFVVFAYVVYQTKPFQYVFQEPREEHMFEVQAVDTMKYSRDLSGQVLDNPEKFKAMIDQQIVLIKDVGATHVAIATPYDERFVPVLRLWVDSARAHGLSVWFRGNFSGWEEWFGYSSIDREEHKRLLVSFIQENPDLFASGDVFSPCPECENGGPGDPRMTGDKEGYNDFLIEERTIALKEFGTIGKSLTIYTSMNGDIAREIITPSTLKSLGGTILIDHYVKTPEGFGNDIENISKKLEGKVGLGEFGAPIPDLQGSLTRDQQARVVGDLLYEIYLQREAMPAVNYWTLRGGSTAIVDDKGVPFPAYYTLQSYFKAPSMYGIVYNSLGEPLAGAKISVASTTYSIKSSGYSYQVFLPAEFRTIIIEREGYQKETITYSKDTASSVQHDIRLTPKDPSWWYRTRQFFYGVLKK